MAVMSVQQDDHLLPVRRVSFPLLIELPPALTTLLPLVPPARLPVWEVVELPAV